MDILRYFDLNESPFKTGPDPRFLYFTDQVKESIAKCEYMARERVGPIYIYGPIGSGKTTLLRRLYDRLAQEDRYNVALIISPNLKSSNAFLRLIMEQFEVKTERSYAQSLANFESFLLDQFKGERVPLLLVDEAQNLNRDALKLVHYLLNFETATTKLLQIVLVGQQELATKVLKYRELASRMFPIAINAMSPEELRAMVRFRWTIAGGNVMPFDDTSDEWYKTLYAYSKGLPRDAVKVCDEVLRDLQARNERVAQTTDVEQIAEELNLQL